MSRNVVAVFVLGAALSPAPTFAQMTWEGRGFANIGIGIQAGSRDFTTRSEPLIYDEPALITTAQEVGSGPLFDMAGGYRVWRNLVVGLGYSRFSDSSSTTVSAAIPHPLLPDAPRNGTASVSDLDHSEQALHFVATWMIPVTDKIEVGISAGPSVFFVSQDLVTDVGFTETSDPFTSIVLGTPVVQQQDDTTVGINIGADMTYLLTPRYGVNGFLRYSGASAELPGVEGGDLTVGGLQLGVGFRWRF